MRTTRPIGAFGSLVYAWGGGHTGQRCEWAIVTGRSAQRRAHLLRWVVIEVVSKYKVAIFPVSVAACHIETGRGDKAPRPASDAPRLTSSSAELAQHALLKNWVWLDRLHRGLHEFRGKLLPVFGIQTQARSTCHLHRDRDARIPHLRTSSTQRSTRLNTDE